MSARTSDGSLPSPLMDPRAPGFRRTDGDAWSRPGLTPDAVERYKAAILVARAPSPWRAVAGAYRDILERLADLGDADLIREMGKRFGPTDIATNLDAIELVHTAVHG